MSKIIGAILGIALCGILILVTLFGLKQITGIDVLDYFTSEETPAVEQEQTPYVPPAPAIKYSEGLEYKLNKNQTGYIVKGIGTCTDEVVNIPSTYNGLPVIEVDAFDRDTFKKVIIPDTVTYISGLIRMPNLNEVVFGKNVEFIEDCFGDCPNLKVITIPNKVDCITQCFFGTTKLERIILPKSLEEYIDYNGLSQTEIIYVDENGNVIDNTGETTAPDRKWDTDPWSEDVVIPDPNWFLDNGENEAVWSWFY